jgi:FtsZ-interacting cell division protein ZipA
MMFACAGNGMVMRVRIAGCLVVAAVAGFLLGACGGGGGSSLGPVSGATVTRAPETTAAQPTLPTRTRTVAAPATSVETTTVAVTTTAPAPTTSTPPRTITFQPQTTTAGTTTLQVVPAATTTSAGEPSSSESTPWGWIALVLALAGVAALVIGLWSRRRSRATSWSAHLEDLRRRSLVALDDVIARGSLVSGQVEALTSEARSLERHAPDEHATAQAERVRSALEELAAALEGDRTLRLASPPPTEEQLAYSTALVRQQAEEVRRVLRASP